MKAEFKQTKIGVELKDGKIMRVPVSYVDFQEKTATVLSNDFPSDFRGVDLKHTEFDIIPAGENSTAIVMPFKNLVPLDAQGRKRLNFQFMPFVQTGRNVYKEPIPDAIRACDSVIEAYQYGHSVHVDTLKKAKEVREMLLNEVKIAYHSNFESGPDERPADKLEIWPSEGTLLSKNVPAAPVPPYKKVLISVAVLLILRKVFPSKR